MTDVKASKSQERACALFGLSHDGTYAGAARSLESKMLEADGIPSGETWRTAAKLTDEELKAKLVATRDAFDHAASVGSLRSQYGE